MYYSLKNKSSSNWKLLKGVHGAYWSGEGNNVKKRSLSYEHDLSWLELLRISCGISEFDTLTNEVPKRHCKNNNMQ